VPDAKGGMRAAPRPMTAAQPPPMSEPKGAGPAGSSLLFLREEEIRLAQDLLFFAYRDFTNAADVILEELGLGRAHHRALHFIGRNPGIPVSDLLAILRVTKQSLARVLAALIEQGYVAQAPGRADRRQRLLSLTPQGEALERRLFERQKDRIVAAYREAGGPAVEGFRRVMRGIMDEAARTFMDRAEAAGNPVRPRVGDAAAGHERRPRSALATGRR
jgi:DNA-binding MarR family transcriptional regulator